MVETIRKFDLAKKYRSRLVYIDPTLSKKNTPTLNPLECWLKEPIALDIQTNQLLRSLEEMMPDAKLSLTMRAVIKPCLYVLLSYHTCTFETLQSFLHEEDGTWVNRGKKSPVLAYRNFFTNERNNPLYERTKQSLSTKIQSLLNSQIFYQMTIGKSTIDLQRLTRQGKIILFNLSKGKMGEEVAETLGRFLIAQIKSIALQRS